MAKNINFDLNAWSADAQNQFRGLDTREPGQWPLLPKLLSFVGVVVVVLGGGWFGLLSDKADELTVAESQEPKLKADYRDKLGQAINLSELRKQRTQVQEYVTQLEKQLPGKAEMDALLSDINQAGLGRGLDFELFRPGSVTVKDYYAELPIAIRVSGRYHDIGAFTADIANLSRIVTLHDLSIGVPANMKDGGGSALFMEATARTYRYLDPAEVQAQRDTQKSGAKDKKGGSK